MQNIAMDVRNLVEILPQDDQRLAYELVKKLVLAWDPNFTKTTPEEAARIKSAEESGFVNEKDIDWEKIGV